MSYKRTDSRVVVVNIDAILRNTVREMSTLYESDNTGVAKGQIPGLVLSM